MYEVFKNLEKEKLEELTGLKIRGNFLTRKSTGNIDKIKILIPVDPKRNTDVEYNNKLMSYISAFTFMLVPNNRYIAKCNDRDMNYGFIAIDIIFVNNLVKYNRLNIILAEIINAMNALSSKEIDFTMNSNIRSVLKTDISGEEFEKDFKYLFDDKRCFFILETIKPDDIHVDINEEASLFKDITPLKENTGFMLESEDEMMKIWIHIKTMCHIFNLFDSLVTIKDKKLLVSLIGVNLKDMLKIYSDCLVLNDNDREDLAYTVMTNIMYENELKRQAGIEDFIEEFFLFDNPYITKGDEFITLIDETLKDKDTLEKFNNLLSSIEPESIEVSL